jgi:hypothetical protein
MALPALTDSLEALPEPIRGEYARGDGSAQRPDTAKFYLDVTPVGGFSLEDKSGLIATLEARKAEGKSMKDTLKAFEGLDAQAARNALARIEELEASGGGEAVDARLESLRTQLTGTFSAEKETWGGEKAALESQLSKVLIDDRIRRALEGKGSADLLLPVLRESIRMVKDDTGELVARVYDSKGNELVSRRAENNGLPMEISEHVESVRLDERYARAFDGSGPAGSGGAGTAHQAGTQNQGGQHLNPPEKPSSPAERIERARQNAAQA